MRGPNGLSLTYWMAMATLTVVTFTGCQGGPSRRTLASAEPALSPSLEPGTVIAQSPTTVASAPASARTLTFVDRHPLFSRPREYYENGGSNKVVKTAAAVVVGVPAGIFGELRQIVVGAPPEPHY
jgi:hypothetical protein